MIGQPAAGHAGSLLIYPLVDSQPATATLINLTNTNTDTTRCLGSTERGSIRAHYIYFGSTQADIDAGTATWREFDRIETLTPGDTLSVLASDHNPEGEVGYLMVQALDPISGDLIDFDHLIGSAYVANSNLDIMWSYLPYAFLGNPNNSVLATTACGNGILGSFQALFDGDMYDTFPDVLFVDSFFEENPGTFDSRLVLLSAVDANFDSEIFFLFFNNDEDAFSRTLRFNCWMSSSLLDITGTAGNLNGDPDEFQVETGWARIDGSRILTGTGFPVSDPDGPPLLGVFMQAIRSDFTAGHQLQFSGSQANAELP